MFGHSVIVSRISACILQVPRLLEWPMEDQGGVHHHIAPLPLKIQVYASSIPLYKVHPDPHNLVALSNKVAKPKTLDFLKRSAPTSVFVLQ
jgi:hypothetical protein